MDMHMHMVGNATMMMMPWLHFGGGDAIWFLNWMPMSAGAVAGAAVGLFLLALVERWVSAMRGVMEAWWTVRTLELVSQRFQTLQSPSREKAGTLSEEGHPSITKFSLPTPNPLQIAHLRSSAPFIWSHDLSRGAMQTVQTALMYALMLAVMTFNASYIIAIVAGAGVGEVLFGRFGRGLHNH